MLKQGIMEVLLLIGVIAFFVGARVLINRLKQPVSSLVVLIIGGLFMLFIWIGIDKQYFHWKILMSVPVVANMWHMAKKIYSGFKSEKR